MRSGETCSNMAGALLDKKFFPDLAAANSITNMDNLWDYNNYDSKLTPQISSVLALNPGLNCNLLYKNQPLCVNVSSTKAAATPVICARTYTTKQWDTCSSITQSFFPSAKNNSQLIG